MTRTWKFTMGIKRDPCWSMYEPSPIPDGTPKLVAYAKRAKNAGWFVRISELNDNVATTDKIYIDDDVFPPNFMATMLELHKNPNSKTI